LEIVGFITYEQSLREANGGREESVATLTRHNISLAHPKASFGHVLGGAITLLAKVTTISNKLDDEEEANVRNSILDQCDYHLSGDDAARLLFLRLKTGV
jgi:hypothetical protein